MSVTTGPITVSRFRVLGTPPANIGERLAEHAFTPFANAEGEVSGWVELNRMLDTDFASPNGYEFARSVCFAHRVDVKRIPTALFKAKLEKKLRQWKAEHQVERVPKTIQAEVKEELEAEMLSRVYPSSKVTDVSWSLDGGYLLVHSHSEKTCDEVRTAFFRTFGVTTAPFAPLDWSNEPGEDDTPCPPEQASAFLGWLWQRTEESQWFDGRDFECWVDNRLTFRSAEGTKPEAVMTGEKPGEAPEAKAALEGGKVLSQLRIGLRRDDREWSVTLDGPTLAFKGMKLPEIVAGEGDDIIGAVLDRSHRYEEAFHLIAKMWGEFVESDVYTGVALKPLAQTSLIGKGFVPERFKLDVAKFEEQRKRVGGSNE